MADEKVTQVEHDFSGRPLRPYGELSTHVPEAERYVDTTEYATKDGRWANQAGDGKYYLVDDRGNVLSDQPISEDQLLE